MSTISFTIRVPSEEGFVGRECIQRQCHRYFKIQSADAPNKIFCPYCGELGATNQTHTREQRAYFKKVLEEKARKYAHNEFSKIMRSAFGNLPSSGAVKFEFKPSAPYQEKPVYKNYWEKPVDTDLVCPDCNYTFKVYGIFGFCPRCRVENAQIYDTNLAIIRKEFEAAPDKKRALRHAYADLVSTLENFCKTKAPQAADEKRRSYQRLADVEELAVARLGKTLEKILIPEELAALHSAFQKRHVVVHNAGIADARFAREIAGSESSIGKPVHLSIDEFECAAQAVQHLIAALFVPSPK